MEALHSSLICILWHSELPRSSNSQIVLCEHTMISTHKRDGTETKELV